MIYKQYKIESFITDLRLVTILMLFYIFGYSFKAYFLFDKALNEIVINEIARALTSVFSSLVTASVLLMSYIHKDKIKLKFLPYVLFISDILMMMFILEVIKNKTIRSIFISILYAVIGMLLISIFKAIFEQERAQAEQERAKEEQKQAKIEQQTKYKCLCGKGYPTTNALAGHQSKCKIYLEDKARREQLKLNPIK